MATHPVERMVGRMDMLLRSAVLVAGLTAYFGMLRLAGDSANDPNIGAGLLAFLLIVVTSGVWGFFDGRRLPVGRVVQTWAVAGAALGLVMLGLVVWNDGEWDGSVIVADLVVLFPFMVGLVLVPAAIGAAIGSSRPATAPRPRSH
jgi:hypothetical protein